jgi:hypothetical protein
MDSARFSDLYLKDGDRDRPEMETTRRHHEFEISSDQQEVSD